MVNKLSIKVKFSTHFKAVQSRLRRLPKIVEETLDTFAKRDCARVIKEYQKGIKQDLFPTERLHEKTIEIKAGKGYQQPDTPLYGKGEDEKNSLYNALAIRKIKNGYRLYVRWAKHHESDLTLRDLLNIHQRGALIQVTDKMRAFLHWLGIHLRKDTAIIRIPPRPVKDMAVLKVLEKRRREEPAQKIRQAMAEYIKTGRDNLFRKYREFNEREVALYE